MGPSGHNLLVSIEPDTKDWTWVTRRACEQCGFDPAEVAAEQLADLLHENTRGWYGHWPTPTTPYAPPRTCGRGWSTPATSATCTGSSPSGCG